MNHPRNLVGPRIRELRDKVGLTQPDLAAKCNLLGWNLSRETLAKIETQIRWVSDCELLCLARALGIKVDQLLVSNEHSPAKVRNFLAALGK
jgi:transcriptional regulator with XRE-family HTH domain